MILEFVFICYLYDFLLIILNTVIKNIFVDCLLIEVCYMIGFIAEDIYEIYPIAADYHYDESGDVVIDGWNDKYIIPAMLKLIQEQKKEIDLLKKSVSNLSI